MIVKIAASREADKIQDDLLNSRGLQRERHEEDITDFDKLSDNLNIRYKTASLDGEGLQEIGVNLQKVARQQKEANPALARLGTKAVSALGSGKLSTVAGGADKAMDVMDTAKGIADAGSSERGGDSSSGLSNTDIDTDLDTDLGSSSDFSLSSD